MRLNFTKMQGLGNDFVVLDGLRERIELSGEQVRRLADRHFGIGCDQVLVLEPARGAAADVRYRIYNADGREVEHCGNGLRCVARYLREEGLVEKDELVVESRGGLARVYLEADGGVRVDMGAPRLDPPSIPMRAAARAERYEVEVEGEVVRLAALSLGNPHAVIEVGEVQAAPLTRLGPRLERHPVFPEGVNVGFMQVLDRNHLRLRVFERGVGETLACGTAACAAVVAGRLWGRLGESVQVALPGGTLSIRWAGEGEPVWMTGPASRVFEGTIRL